MIPDGPTVPTKGGTTGLDPTSNTHSFVTASRSGTYLLYLASLPSQVFPRRRSDCKITPGLSDLGTLIVDARNKTLLAFLLLFGSYKYCLLLNLIHASTPK